MQQIEQDELSAIDNERRFNLHNFCIDHDLYDGKIKEISIFSVFLSYYTGKINLALVREIFENYTHFTHRSRKNVRGQSTQANVNR